MQATINVHARQSLGKVNPHIYGHFIEHYHRCIYGGIFDPDSSLSDKRGFRKDVIAALRKLKTPLVRWPGGCYADGYHWKNGVGLKEERPLSLDYAWHQEETNQFGTNEFIDFCHSIDAEPCLCVNAGSGTAEEAAQWVEYCNRKGRSLYPGLREKHGYPEPHGVKFWGVGNELNAKAEIGGPLSGGQYARIFSEFCKLMKRVDPEIKLVAVGSREDNRFNADFLEHAGFLADYISIHYYGYSKETLDDYYGAVATPTYLEGKLKDLIETIRHCQNAGGMDSSPEIAIDEWNPWSWSNYREHGSRRLFPYWGKWVRMEENDINSQYTLRDALTTARFLNLFQRYCEHVTMANISPIVNVRGAVYVHQDGIVLRPPYHVLDLYSNHTGNISVGMTVQCETFDVHVRKRHETSRFYEIKNTPYLDASATRDEGTGKLYLAAVNLHRDQDVDCRIALKGMEVTGEAEVHEINGSDVESYNDEEHPDRIKINRKKIDSCGQSFDYVFPAHSITLMEI